MEKSNRFIVPIYKLINSSFEFWGSGFIIDQYLISAAHVFEEDTDYRMKFDNTFIELKNPAYRRYIKGGNIRYDIQIYRLENINSPYSLHTGDYSWKKDFILDGFNMNENGDAVIRNVLVVKILEDAYEYNLGVKPIKLKNCFLLQPKSTSGNSGCPIVKDNVIYGMNISEAGGEDFMGSNAIRSDFIFDIISNL